MQGPRRSPGRRSAVAFALALAAWAAGGARRVEASSRPSTIEYGTTGTIDVGHLAGPNLVRFDGVGDATVATARPFEVGQIPAVIPGDRGATVALGRFEVRPPAPGVATVYDHTPFQVAIEVKRVDGGSPGAGPDSMIVRGWLDGTIGGAGPSSLVAHYQLAGALGVPFEPRDEVGSFEAGAVRQSLTIPGFATTLALPTGGEGSTALAGVLVGDAPLPSPAPEPGTLLIFVAAGVGLALRGRGRTRVGQA